jgi:hypothetical protein
MITTNRCAWASSRCSKRGAVHAVRRTDRLTRGVRTTCASLQEVPGKTVSPKGGCSASAASSSITSW